MTIFKTYFNLSTTLLYIDYFFNIVITDLRCLWYDFNKKKYCIQIKLSVLLDF